MSFTPNVVVGLVITLTGAALLLDRLGALEARNLFQLWPVLLTLFGISVIVQALRADAPGEQGDASVRRGGRPIIGPGIVLFLVIVWLASSNAIDRRLMATGASGDPELNLIAVMGADTRTSVTPAFQGAQMTSVMGRTRLDLRQATIAPGAEATVDVFGLMGAVEVVVPGTWTIDVQTVVVMGGVRDRRSVRPAGDENDDDADSREARRARRRADRDRERVGEHVVLPPVDPSASATPSISADASAAPAAGAPPRLVLKGVVFAGGLIIRS